MEPGDTWYIETMEMTAVDMKSFAPKPPSVIFITSTRPTSSSETELKFNVSLTHPPLLPVFDEPYVCLFEQEALTRHVPNTSTVHIHVLSVHRHCRQQGKGSILLWRYLQYLRCIPGLRRTLLVCEKFLMPFYEKAGFKEKGSSAITVGALRFREMEYTLAGLAYARRKSNCWTTGLVYFYSQGHSAQIRVRNFALKSIISNQRLKSFWTAQTLTHDTKVMMMVRWNDVTASLTSLVFCCLCSTWPVCL